MHVDTNSIRHMSVYYVGSVLAVHSFSSSVHLVVSLTRTSPHAAVRVDSRKQPCTSHAPFPAMRAVPCREYSNTM